MITCIYGYMIYGYMYIWLHVNDTLHVYDFTVAETKYKTEYIYIFAPTIKAPRATPKYPSYIPHCSHLKLLFVLYEKH